MSSVLNLKLEKSDVGSLFYYPLLCFTLQVSFQSRFRINLGHNVGLQGTIL